MNLRDEREISESIRNVNYTTEETDGKTIKSKGNYFNKIRE